MVEDLDESISFECDKCKRRVAVVERGEHEDWHVAKELARAMQEEDMAMRPRVVESKNVGGGTKRKSTGKGKTGGGKKKEVKKEAGNTSIQSFFKPK
jgi:hypothetical protein